MPLTDSRPIWDMPLNEILSQAAPSGTRASATDIPGVNLEWMVTEAYPSGAWFGTVGNLTQAQLNALPTAFLATGTRASVNGTDYVWGGAAVGWVADATTPFPCGGDDTATLNAALAGGGNVKLAFGETYHITAPLLVPSNTQFNLNGATIATDSTAHRMIQNSGYGVSRNSNIEIFGGSLSAGSEDGDTHRLVMLGVDGIKIHDLSISSLSGKYAVLLADVTEFFVQDISLAVASDGVHVTGPASRGLIENITGTTGDDFVALGCSDYLAYDVSRGDLDDIVVRSLHPRLGVDGGNGCKVFTVAHASITDVLVADKISISGIYGDVKESGVTIMNYAENNGSFGDISVENISVRNTFSAGFPQVDISATAAINTVSCRNIAIPKNQTLSAHNVRANNAARVKNLITENLSDLSVGTTQSNGVLVSGTGTVVSNLVAKNITVSNATSAKDGITVSNSATVGVISLSDIYTEHQYGIRLASGGYCPAICLRGIRSANPGALVSVESTGIAVVQVNYSGIDILSGLFLSIVGATASVKLEGAGFRLSAGSTFYRSASQSLIVASLDFHVALEKLTKANGAMAYNTNAGLSCGVGLAVSDGSVWKNLVSGLTY